MSEAALDAPAARAGGGEASGRLRQVRWSLLFGNFVIGCGVMVVIGTLSDVARSLEVSIAVAGQLVTFAATVICFGAPFLVGWLGGFDRRKLLAASLAWYAIGHGLCALAPSLRRAVAGAHPHHARRRGLHAAGRGRPSGRCRHRPSAAATSPSSSSVGRVASVLGLPVSAWIGDALGWRGAFAAVAAIGCRQARSGCWRPCPAASDPPCSRGPPGGRRSEARCSWAWSW